MKPITANSVEGRVLLALRAGGMDVMQLTERIASSSPAIRQLVRAGLITDDCRHCRITAKGLAACPKRRDAKPEPLHASRSTMSRSHGWSSTRQGVSA